MKISFRSDKAKNPASESGVNVPYGPAKQRVSSLRWYLIVLLVTSPLLVFIWKMVSDLVLQEAPGIIQADITQINAPFSATVNDVLVAIGDSVTEQQPLLQLDNRQIQRQLVKLKQEQLFIQQQLEQSDDPSHGSAKELLATLNEGEQQFLWQERISSAQRLYQFRLQQHQKILYLREQGAATQAEVATSLAQLSQAEDQINALQLQQFNRVVTSDPGLELREQVLSAEIDYLSPLAHHGIKAHNGDTVVEIFVSPGEEVSTGTPLLTLANFETTNILAYLAPEQEAFAKAGQTASVIFGDGQRFEAIVIKAPGLTTRLPAEFAGPFEGKSIGIMITLQFQHQLPANYQIHGLPVTVRF